LAAYRPRTGHTVIGRFFSEAKILRTFFVASLQWPRAASSFADLITVIDSECCRTAKSVFSREAPNGSFSKYYFSELRFSTPAKSGEEDSRESAHPADGRRKPVRKARKTSADDQAVVLYGNRRCVARAPENQTSRSDASTCFLHILRPAAAARRGRLDR
jgi:hypothetical protein